MYFFFCEVACEDEDSRLTNSAGTNAVGIRLKELTNTLWQPFMHTGAPVSILPQIDKVISTFIPLTSRMVWVSTILSNPVAKSLQSRIKVVMHSLVYSSLFMTETTASESNSTIIFLNPLSLLSCRPALRSHNSAMVVSS